MKIKYFRTALYSIPFCFSMLSAMPEEPIALPCNSDTDVIKVLALYVSAWRETLNCPDAYVYCEMRNGKPELVVASKWNQGYEIRMPIAIAVEYPA